jgi:hypothetical protein
MTRTLALLILCGSLLGCMPAIHHPRVVRDFSVPEAPAVAYPKALRATMAVQGQIHQQAPALGLINATVQRAVSLNVSISPAGTGSHIEVAHQVAPTHIVSGTVTLVDDWIAAYQAQR